MNTNYLLKTNLLFAQAYGSDAYGTEEYSDCTVTADGCIPTTSTGAPNTGFLGLSPDAAIASGAGALLLAIAIVGIVTVFIKRHSRKTKTQE